MTSSSATSNTTTSGGATSNTATSSSAGSSSGPCGGLTAFGECQGNVLRYCGNVSHKIIEQDCTTMDNGAPGTCKLMDDEWGYDCAVTGTNSCLFVDADETPYILLCAEPDHGCLINVLTEVMTATCTPGMGTCTTPPEGQTFPNTCQDNNVVRTCRASQPVAYTCGAGTCEGGLCRMPAGEMCSRQADTIYVCGTGLTCSTTDYVCE